MLAELDLPEYAVAGRGPLTCRSSSTRLRKSEHERQRSTAPGLSQVPLATPTAQLPRWALVADRRARSRRARARRRVVAEHPRSASRPAASAPPLVERSVELPAPRHRERRRQAQRADVGRRRATARARGCVAGGRAEPRTRGGRARGPHRRRADALARRQLDLPAADAPALPSAAAPSPRKALQLPPLRLELHAFSGQPRDRFVFINGRKYVEGERLAEGPAAPVDRAHGRGACACGPALLARAGVIGRADQPAPRRRDQRLVVVGCGSLTPKPTGCTSSAGGRSASFATSSTLLLADRATARARARGISSGIRSWTCASCAFASVVTITQVSSLSPLGVRQRSHKPASASNGSSPGWMKCGRLRPPTRLAPLVEAARRDQAAAPRPGFAECRLRRDAIEPRVDEPAADGGVLGPERDQPPLQSVEAPPAIVLAHDGDGLARGQVIARRRREGGSEIREAEVLLEHLGSNEQSEPAAHVTPGRRCRGSASRARPPNRPDREADHDHVSHADRNVRRAEHAVAERVDHVEDRIRERDFLPERRQ